MSSMNLNNNQLDIPTVDFDIDMDFRSDFRPNNIFENVVLASQVVNKKLIPHPCGAYFQKVPIDPLTGLAAAPYKMAQELGCFKIDFLHLNVYDYFSSREDIRELLKTEPDWELLSIPSVIKKLFQVGNHFELIEKVKPRSVIELADCLALIRPQKHFMLKAYLQDREKIRESLYKHEHYEEGYAFKKAHAIAYAFVIILELHLIKAGIK